MSFVFSSMTPLATLTKYNLGMLNVMDDEKKLMNFLRMEKWLHDRPHHPGEAGKQWMKDLYQDNKLVKNQFELSGRKVELPNITMPVLNIYAENDHIIPPQTSRALGDRRHRRLHRDRPARRTRGRVRERQVAGRARQGNPRLAARAAVMGAPGARMAKLVPRFDDVPVLGPHGFTRMGYTEWGSAARRAPSSACTA